MPKYATNYFDVSESQQNPARLKRLYSQFSNGSLFCCSDGATSSENTTVSTNINMAGKHSSGKDVFDKVSLHRHRGAETRDQPSPQQDLAPTLSYGAEPASSELAVHRVACTPRQCQSALVTAGQHILALRGASGKMPGSLAQVGEQPEMVPIIHAGCGAQL